jgi:hypothetical protein
VQSTFGLLNGICWIWVVEYLRLCLRGHARGGSGRSHGRQEFIFQVPAKPLNLGGGPLENFLLVEIRANSLGDLR